MDLPLDVLLDQTKLERNQILVIFFYSIYANEHQKQG